MALELPPARQGRPARHVRHPQLISADNPLGLNPNDPSGQDDVVIDGDDLHLPVGKPVKMLLRSIDVLHDFYVPEFRAKMDMIPGSVTYFWFTPTRTGTFEVLCAELCGVGHPQMRGTRRGRDRGRLPGLAEQQQTFAQLHVRAKPAARMSRDAAVSQRATRDKRSATGAIV